MNHKADRIPSQQAMQRAPVSGNGSLSPDDWYALIIEASADGSWFHDIDGDVVHYSPRFLDILDVDPNEQALTPGWLFEQIHPQDRAAYKQALVRHLKGETEVLEMEIRVFNGSGGSSWILNRGIARRDKSGHAYCMLGSIVDITRRKQLEESLRTVALSSIRDTGTAFFESLVRYLSQALGSDLAMIGRLDQANPGRVETMAVYRDGDLLENFHYDLNNGPCQYVLGHETCVYPDRVAELFPDDRMLSDEAIRAYIGAPLVDANGGGVGVIAALYRRPLADPALAEDLLRIFAARAAAELERTDKERALARSERRFRELYHQTPVMLHSIDRAGRLLAVSGFWLQCLGYAEQEVLGRPSTDFLTQASREYALKEVLPEFFRTGVCRNIPYQVVKASGEVIDVLLSAVAEMDEQGNIERSLAVMLDVTDQRRAEAEYRDIFNHASEGIYRATPAGRLVRANPALVRLHGFDSEASLIAAATDLGRQWYVNPADRERITRRLDREGRVDNFEVEIYRQGTGQRAELRQHLDDKGYVDRFEAEVRPLNGEGRIWTSETVRVTRGADGEALYYEGSVRDITLQYKARQLASQRSAVLEMIARDAPVPDILREILAIAEQQQEQITAAIFKLRAGRLRTMAAPGLAEACVAAINGLPPSGIGGALYAALHGADDLAEMGLDEMPPGDALAGAMDEAGYRGVLAVPVRDQRGTVLGVLVAFATHDSVLHEAPAELLREMAQLASIAIEQHRLSKALRRQAQYDPLTGLPNRALLSDRLDQAIREARRSGCTIGVLLLDLDEFKLINDSLGHGAGDELLKGVATRLGHCLRGGDTVARLGGDEFVVIVSLPDGETGCDNVAERLLRALQEKVPLAGREVNARPSIGISLFPQDGDSTEALLQAADTAMYAAKHAGKNQYRYFAPSMNRRVSERLQMESELHGSLARHELELYYQPRIDLSSGAPCGAEALPRWHHPERGLLSASAFIHFAEHGPLVSDIDRVVMAQAARRLAAWQRQGRELVISVNVSARELHTDGFAAQTARELEAAGVDASQLELEITESVLMQDYEQTRRQLFDLKERAPGLRIAIDDFGSGYSSLNYLRQLPIDTLKIDGSFVADLDGPDAATAAAIAKTIVELGRNLGLVVVGEGVETAAQAASLLRFGCHQAQGFLYAPALPAHEFEQKLALEATART